MDQNYQGACHRSAQPRLPFLAMLNLPDLSRLINDPVSHDPAWLTVPNKLPLDIPKFEGKAREDLSEHVITFHLWCSSNSLHDDSICLMLFQRTLIGPTVKWYIEIPRVALSLFYGLAMNFLNYFQLRVRYEFGTKLLLTFRQEKAMHISNHIQ